MANVCDFPGFQHRATSRQQQQQQEEQRPTHYESENNLRGRRSRLLVERSRERFVSECKGYLKIICEKCDREGSGKRPLKVVFLGTQGCGKSSFINSLAASLSQDKWVEHTTVGYRDNATPITNFITQHRKCGNHKRPLYQNVLLPTLIDVPGLLEEEADEQMTKFLLLLFYGHIKSQTAASLVYADCMKDWEDLQKTYSTMYDDMKVDRVIFVASAANDNLPHRLMECVMNAAKPPPNPQGFKRQIPVYGVLTNLDQVHNANREQFEQTKAEFMSALGLHEGRILCCSNYCDDTDPDKNRFKQVMSSIDLPILEFFSQVCEREAPTIHDDDRIPVDFVAGLRGDWQKLSSTTQAMVTSLFVAFLSFMAVFAVHATFLSSEKDVMLLQRCKSGDQSVADLCQAARTPFSLQAAGYGGVIGFIAFWCFRHFRRF